MPNILELLGLQPQMAQPQQAAPMVNPAPMPTNEAQAPDLATQWNGYLSDPTTKAAMLSAGLAMMRPNWGGPGQAIVSGIGAGAETVGDRQTAQMALDRQAKNDAEQASERADRKKDKTLDREQTLEIAKMTDRRQRDLKSGLAGGGGMSKGAPALYQKVFKEEYDKMKDPITGELPEGTDPLEAATAAQSAAEARLSHANQFLAGKDGATGAAASSGTTPPGATKSPGPPSQINSTVQRQQFKNSSTGKTDWFVKKDGKWVKE